MVFSSAVFLFVFLPILLFIYFVSKYEYRNVVLLAASLVFYAWGEPKNVLLMLLSIVVNYVLGIVIEKYASFAKVCLVLAVCYNLGMLYVFKYLNFSVNIVNGVLGTHIYARQIILPIGISFYTFQILSYVVDVYRGNVSAQKNILNLALYISLFPQLIAGPIVRYVDVEKQIHERTSDVDGVYYGFRRFAIGFSKKVLIADQLSPLVDTVFSGEYPSIWAHWVGIAAYTLQIYYDFSGYSDMAIGLGKIFGFDFLENFNYPYISRSIKEFWRRWHISLSSWFRDYLYIPLGGSRKGQVRTYINLVIVFFMTGLWHGASFNFIAWGLFYVIFLILERLGLESMLKKIPVVFQHLYALLIIMIGWVFFRAEGLKNALIYIRSMFVPAGGDLANLRVVMNGQYWFCLLLGICFAVPHSMIREKLSGSKAGGILSDVMTIAVFLLAVCYMIGSGYSPFLYFRF